MSRSEQVELKPCPFCGGNVTLTTGGKSDGLLTFVCDEGSTCRGSKIFTGTLVEDRETAITAWNTRAPSALPVEGWRDIATVPRDGTPFLACVAVYSSETKAFLYWDRHIIAADPETGEIWDEMEQGWRLEEYDVWMPLPSPPEPGVK
jgi:hypothetical protein